MGVEIGGFSKVQDKQQHPLRSMVSITTQGWCSWQPGLVFDSEVEEAGRITDRQLHLWLMGSSWKAQSSLPQIES